MDSIIESWGCQIESDLTVFFESLEDDVTKFWSSSSIGHRIFGCKPVKGEYGAYFIFSGDGDDVLASLSVRMERTGWLGVVIDRYETAPENIEAGYATWAEVGQTVTRWLCKWVETRYNIKPKPQRAGEPWLTEDDQGGGATTPQDIEAALAPLRDTLEFWPELERLVRAYWQTNGKRALPITGKGSQWTVEKISGFNRSYIYQKTGLGEKSRHE